MQTRGRSSAAHRGTASTDPPHPDIGTPESWRFDAGELSHVWPRPPATATTSRLQTRGGVRAVRAVLDANSIRAVRPGSDRVTGRIRPIAAQETCPGSRAHIPRDQKARTSVSRRTATRSLPERANPCARRNSDDRRHRTRSRYFHPRFEASTHPGCRAKAH